MSISTPTAIRWRSNVVEWIPSFWKNRSSNITQDEEILFLKTENLLLKNQLIILNTVKNTPPLKEAIIARVVFRPFNSWNSSLWIDKGELDNTTEYSILKNSPVVVGKSIIGVIDYVGKHQSRVRLITDASLNPSVRVFRKEDPLEKNSTRLYLAKGELQGGSGPYWRRGSSILRGTGFNYDFEDEKGRARDLRTGKIMGQVTSSSVPLLKVNDLLVTTGMDGIFPPDWEVAIVTKIELLKEGDYFYELEAIPTAGNLHDLKTVFIIPPIGFDPENRPM
jgi:rod shape-determining protein MreC